MKTKLINHPEDAARECLEGFVSAYPGQYELIPGITAVKRKQAESRVTLVIGGGSGHEPMFAFFVGEGLADASVNGRIFTSPDPMSILKTVKAVDQGKGTLLVYGNYAGDNMNFDMAAEMLKDFRIRTETVRVMDDIASAPGERRDDRRGVAGDVYAVKIAGAACMAGLDLDEVKRVTKKACDQMATIGVALSGATIPGEETAIFTLRDGEMEYGLGIHGEPGIKRISAEKADVITETLVTELVKELGLKAGDVVCSYVNGLGATTLMELYIINRKLRQLLDEKGIGIHDMLVDQLVTSQEMAGASVTLMKVDGELIKYYDAPCSSPHFKK